MPKAGAHLIDRVSVRAETSEEAREKVRNGNPPPPRPPPRYILRSRFIVDDLWEVQVFDTQ